MELLKMNNNSLQKLIFMKKILLIFLVIVLFSSNIFALSLFGAQDISKEYLSENDMIDTFTQPKISCEDEEYFVIPIVNSLGESILFVPISNESSQVYLSETDSFNINLIKTEYLLKSLKNSNPSNYLSSQLIDRINSIITSLNSKKAQLNGLLEKSYSAELNSQITITINHINNLIVYLEDLKESLTSLINFQNSFLSSPDCKDTSSLLNSFDSSFKGYDKLSQASLEYIQESEQLVTKIVAEDNIPANEISGLVNLVSPPSSLNSNINYVYESLSSTSSFYSKLYLDLKGDDKVSIFIDNLKLRMESVKLNDLMTSYDTSFTNYNNLEHAITTILNDEYKPYWKEQSEVDALFRTYNEYNDLVSKAQYSQAIDKVSILKSKSKIIIDSGFIEEEVEQNSVFYYIVISVIIIILIIFLIIIKSKKKPKKQNFTKKTQKDGLLSYDDPF